MRKRIEDLDVDGARRPRQQALDKLAKFSVKIGYPSKWRDYSAIVVNDGDLLRQSASGRPRFEWDYDVGRIGQTGRQRTSGA